MGAPKKLLKKNPELEALIREVEGHPSNHPKFQAKTGGAIKPQPVTEKPKALTPKLKKDFKALCKERVDLAALIESHKERLSSVNANITKITNTYGRPLLEARKDRVVYTEPYKAHLVWNDRAGAIESDEVAKVFPELMDPGFEKVDLTKLAEVIETFQVDPSVKELVRKFRAIVLQLEKSAETTLVDKEDSGLLNMEKYREYRENGKFTPEMLEKFEQTEGNYSLRIDKLSERPRFSCCGNPKPKRTVEGAKVGCPRCGHSE